MIFASIAIGFFFSLLYFFETIGYVFRLIGKRHGLASLGYSIHVQCASSARMFTFFAYPVVGYLLDLDVSYVYIAIMIILTSSIFIIFMTLILINYELTFHYANKFFIWYTQKFYKITQYERGIKFNRQFHSLEINKNKYFYLSAFLAFFIVVVGVFSSIFMAALYHEKRAMFLQASALFTSVGTLISIFYFDPKLSTYIDKDDLSFDVIKAAFISRYYAMITILILFLLVIFLNFHSLELLNLTS
jgi:hypothetical protein